MMPLPWITFLNKYDVSSLSNGELLEYFYYFIENEKLKITTNKMKKINHLKRDLNEQRINN
jgi:hypothetical protein